MKNKRPRVQAIDVFLILTIGLAVALWVQATALKPPFDIYPKMVILLVGLFSLICLIQNLLSSNDSTKSKDGYSLWVFLTVIGSIFLYIIAIDVIGYFTSTLVYLILFFLIKRIEIEGWQSLSLKGIATDTAIALTLTFAVGLVFKLGLKLVFPEALLI